MVCISWHNMWVIYFLVWKEFYMLLFWALVFNIYLVSTGNLPRFLSAIAVEDLNLNAVESLQGGAYVAIGKHLCGPATGIWKFHQLSFYTKCYMDMWCKFGADMTLRCCLQQQSDQDSAAQIQASCHLRGLAIATCCHHLCQWKTYTSNKSKLRSVLLVKLSLQFLLHCQLHN